MGSDREPNTFIGNVADLYPTKEDLATILSLSASEIQSFRVVGNDIQCYIGTNYSTSNEAFLSSSISKYIDNNNRLTNLGLKTFRFCHSLTELKINAITAIDGQAHEYNDEMVIFNYPNLTNAGGTSIFYRCYNVTHFILPLLGNCVNTMFKMIVTDGTPQQEVIYIPEATVIGSSISVNNEVFKDISSSAVVYVNPYVLTVNGGVADPDIQYLIDRGNDVRSVINYTAPSAIDDLAITSSALDTISLSWTAPTSTNAIDFYEVYINDIYVDKTTDLFITLDDFEIVGFSYKVTVKVRDYLYNLSAESNTINYINTGI